MSLQITYFVHGTTTDNEQGLATGWLPGELSKTAKHQARHQGELVSERFAVMVSSDLQRAIDSAELGFAGRFPTVTDRRLRECNYGDLDGADVSVVKADMAARIDRPFPNGESYKDVEARKRELLEELQVTYDGQHIAFMAHQAPQLALEVIVHGKTWQEAIETDWRRTGAWQPGWMYEI